MCGRVYRQGRIIGFSSSLLSFLSSASFPYFLVYLFSLRLRLLFLPQTEWNRHREGGRPLSSSFSTSHVCLSRIFRFSLSFRRRRVRKYNKEGGKKRISSVQSLFSFWEMGDMEKFDFSVFSFSSFSGVSHCISKLDKVLC